MTKPKLIKIWIEGEMAEAIAKRGVAVEDVEAEIYAFLNRFYVEGA